jgi:parallel beta-helix repeat protein
MSSNENADPAQIGMRIRGANGQTADLLAVEKYDGTDVFKVDKDGYITKLLDPNTPSFIIWKSGSTYYIKNGATGAVAYTGTVFETVWASMMATLTSGGFVYIKSGTYTKTNVTALDILSNVEIYMEPGANITLSNNVGDSPGIFAATSKTNITIRGGMLDGNKAGQTTTAGIGAMAISFTSVTDSLIFGVHIKNVGTAAALSGYGIYLNASTANRIIGNHIEGCKRENAVLFNGSNNCIVQGNIFEDADDRHMVVHNSDYVIITDNVLSTSVGYAIQAFSDTTNYGVTISNNVIDTCTSYGIVCSGITRAKVFGNRVRSTGDYGINVSTNADFAEVFGNSVEDATLCGIYVAGAHVRVTDNTIEATATQGATDKGISVAGDHAIIACNVVDNTGTGIQLSGDYGQVANNTVAECDCTASAMGIYLLGGFADVVSGNQLFENQRGIYLNSTCDRSILIANTVHASDGDGIYIDGSTDILVMGNMLSDNGVAAGGGAMNGIGIGSPASGIAVVGNIFDKGTHQQVGLRAFAGVTNLRVFSNDFTNGGTVSSINDASTTALIRYNVGYITENSGTSTGTGAQQTIAHGLAAAPTRVLLSESTTGGALAYQSAAADATNIYITATNAKTYQWEAKVV